MTTTTIETRDHPLGSRTLNSLALLGVSLSLAIAFYYQLAFGELPCPLCQLQRAGLMLIGLGFLLNVRFGIRSGHYGIVLLGALATGAISVRQMFLHIAPGTGVYGSPLLGLHFYTWAAITAALTVLFVAVMLGLRSCEHPSSDSKTGWLGKLAIGVFVALIAANLVSTLLECGFGECAADPQAYQWLSGH
ncbi:MAG TPA: disulfide bond formation protein B [Trinickia sp.]|nr:disulfide bond formation protein B [Trinickia sp.]